MPKKSKAQSQPAPEEEDNVQIIGFDTFDLERFALKARSLTEQKDSTQFMCFPKYCYEGDPEGDYDAIMDNGESALIVTDEIVINKGGIPRFNAKYHSSQDAMSRAYFYIAKDEECPGSVELFDFLRKIDDYFDLKINKEDNKDEIVCYTTTNKKTKKEVRKAFRGLTYKRMVTMTKPPTRMPEEEEEEDDDSPKKEYVPYERIKVKFSTVWDDNLGPNDPKDIDTVLFIPGKEDPVEATRVTDFDKYFTWKCTAKFGIMINKFWIDKKDERNCSFGLKCVQLAVTETRPDTQKKTATSQLSRNLFTGKKINKATTEDEDTPAADEDNDNDDEVDENEGDESSDDEVDEDEEGEDEEDEDDEDESEDEDDDDDENEEGDDDDDDEDESEDDESVEEEPSKKTAKGKKAPVKKAPANKNVKVKGKTTTTRAKGKKSSRK